MTTHKSKAVEHSPADITVTDRDVAVDHKDTVINLDDLVRIEQKYPGSVFEPKPEETLSHTEVTDEFVLDTIQKILSRLEALEDLNLEERIRKYNIGAPHKL